MTSRVSRSIWRAGELAGRSAGRQRRESFLDGSDVRTLSGKGGLQRGNVCRHSNKHVEDEPEGPNQNCHGPGANCSQPAQSDPEFGNFRPEFSNISLRGDAAGDRLVDRIAQRLRLRLGKAGIRQALDGGVCIERHVHATNIGSGEGPRNPRCQAVLQRSLPAAMAVLLALPATCIAQSEPFGTVADGQADLRALFGDCPRERLTEAWNEIEGLEAAAVELEVLRICTDRAEAIARLMDAQARLDGSLGILRASGATPSAVPAPVMADGRMEGLRSEVASLRARIARLEEEPEGPETEAALLELRGDLATAEADLARIEEEAAIADAVAPSDVVPPNPDWTGDEIASLLGEAPPIMSGGSELADEAGSSLVPTGSVSPDLPQADADPPFDFLPPPGTEPPVARLGEHSSVLSGQDSQPSPPPSEAIPGATSVPAGSGRPQNGRTEWRVIHAVRRGDGPWEVLLQGSREIAIEVPGAPGEDQSMVHWQPVLDLPVTLLEGERREDGLAVREIVPEGVWIDDPASPDGTPVLVPFRTNESFAAGNAEWEFSMVGEDG